MELDVIGYRYTAEELAVLMSLQGKEKIPAIPGICLPDREQFARGITSLEEDDILTHTGGRILLDKIHAFLAGNLCECDRFFSVDKDRQFLALCACPQIAMSVSSRDGEHWVLRVAPDVGGIQEDFEAEIRRFRESCRIRTAEGGTVTEENLTDPAALKKKSKEAVKTLKKPVEYFE